MVTANKVSIKPSIHRSIHSSGQRALVPRRCTRSLTHSHLRYSTTANTTISIIFISANHSFNDYWLLSHHNEHPSNNGLDTSWNIVACRQPMVGTWAMRIINYSIALDRYHQLDAVQLCYCFLLLLLHTTLRPPSTITATQPTQACHCETIVLSTSCCFQHRIQATHTRPCHCTGSNARQRMARTFASL
jgi:hypothetical protein